MRNPFLKAMIDPFESVEDLVDSDTTMHDVVYRGMVLIQWSWVWALLIGFVLGALTGKCN